MQRRIVRRADVLTQPSRRLRKSFPGPQQNPHSRRDSRRHLIIASDVARPIADRLRASAAMTRLPYELRARNGYRD
jgi:hypothetical protein